MRKKRCSFVFYPFCVVRNVGDAVKDKVNSGQVHQLVRLQCVYRRAENNIVAAAYDKLVFNDIYNSVLADYRFVGGCSAPAGLPRASVLYFSFCRIAYCFFLPKML